MAVGTLPFPARADRVSIDVSAALALEGVEDVLVGADVVSRSDPISVLRPVADAPDAGLLCDGHRRGRVRGPSGRQRRRVSRHVAEDAIGLIEIDYEPLPHVFDVESAMDPRSPVLHPDVSEVQPARQRD